MCSPHTGNGVNGNGPKSLAMHSIPSQVGQDERAFGEMGVADELEDGLELPAAAAQQLLNVAAAAARLRGVSAQLDHQPRDEHPLVAEPRQHHDRVQVDGDQVEEELGEVRRAAAVCEACKICRGSESDFKNCPKMRS